MTAAEFSSLCPSPDPATNTTSTGSLVSGAGGENTPHVDPGATAAPRGSVEGPRGQAGPPPPVPGSRMRWRDRDLCPVCDAPGVHGKGCDQ